MALQPSIDELVESLDFNISFDSFFEILENLPTEEGVKYHIGSILGDSDDSQESYDNFVEIIDTVITFVILIFSMHLIYWMSISLVVSLLIHQT